MATPTLIQNRSFISVESSGAIAPNFNSPIQLTALDDQGNTIKKTIVEVNASAGVVQVLLPIISTLGNDLNMEINIIVLDNTQNIVIDAGNDGINPPVDYIGQNQSITIIAGTYTSGAVLTFSPAYEGFWALNETIN